jgi:hypothetical protein
MRVLIADVSESQFRSVQTALDAECIRHIDAGNQFSDGISTRRNSIAVDDEDYARALRLIRSLQKTESPQWNARSIRIAIALIVVMSALLAVFWITA